MNAVVSAVVEAVGTVLALWSLVWALLQRVPSKLQNNASLGYQVVLVVQAVGAVVALLVDRRPGDLGIFIGYLVVSVLVQPVLLIAVPSDTARGKSLVLALALFSAAVVVLRMQTTWDVR